MKISQLRAVVAVAERGNFSEAALELQRHSRRLVMRSLPWKKNWVFLYLLEVVMALY